MSDSRKNLKELTTSFLEHLEVERGLSSLTVRNYGFWLSRFEGWCRENDQNFSVDKLNNDIVLKYRLWLSRKKGRIGAGMSSVTQAYHMIALRSFLRWCAKMDVQTLSPEKIDIPKSRGRSLLFLPPNQMDRLLGAPTGMKIRAFRDRAILEVLFSTGLRVSELVSLNRDQVDLKQREFGVIGKGGRNRLVFLSERAIQKLTDYLSKRDDHFTPLFIRYGGKKPDPTTSDASVRLTTRSVERLVEHYRKKVGLATKITPHGIRHSFATDLLRGGADLREVQELLGHKNVSTTQIYTHVTNRQLREVHQRAHSGNKRIDLST